MLSNPVVPDTRPCPSYVDTVAYNMSLRNYTDLVQFHALVIDEEFEDK
jgi:hypothetical protein